MYGRHPWKRRSSGAIAEPTGDGLSRGENSRLEADRLSSMRR
ncbi:hypothetical protein HMPREF1155_1283 [Slackia sp. CM382]|nr:hypothetical protein HMPREF1155_1283 [Slackia sp. CM382]